MACNPRGSNTKSKQDLGQLALLLGANLRVLEIISRCPCGRIASALVILVLPTWKGALPFLVRKVLSAFTWLMSWNILQGLHNSPHFIFVYLEPVTAPITSPCCTCLEHTSVWTRLKNSYLQQTWPQPVVPLIIHEWQLMQHQDYKWELVTTSCIGGVKSAEWARLNLSTVGCVMRLHNYQHSPGRASSSAAVFRVSQAQVERFCCRNTLG